MGLDLLALGERDGDDILRSFAVDRFTFDVHFFRRHRRADRRRCLRLFHFLFEILLGTEKTCLSWFIRSIQIELVEFSL